MPQMKEQEKPPERGWNEMEASNLSDIEYKVMVTRMLNCLRKDTETTKKGLVKNEEYAWKEELIGVNKQ